MHPSNQAESPLYGCALSAYSSLPPGTRFGSRHAIHLAGCRRYITPLLALLLVGCGTVNPEADYERAASLVEARTGADSSYRPSAEAAVTAQTDTLRQDGLSVDEAVHIALLNNRGFQSQFQAIGVSRADLVQSSLLSNPTLTFSARMLDVGGRANLSFGLAQELADLWQIPVRKRIAKSILERTILEVANASVDLAARVRTAYFLLRARQESESLAGENLELLRHTLEITQRRFDAGETTILDVNLIQSSLIDGTVRVATAHRDTLVARAALLQLLGLMEQADGCNLTSPMPEISARRESDGDLVRQALDVRLDIRMASLDLDSAWQEIAQQKRALLPSVAIGIEGERPDSPSATTQKDLSSQISALDTLASSPSQALRDQIVQHIDGARQRKLDASQSVDLLLGPSLQIALPIFDQNRAQTAKARFAYTQKQKDYEQLLTTVVQEVLQAAANAHAAEEIMRVLAKQALPLAEQNVETARRVYEAGEESVLALLLAQQNYNSQRETRITTNSDYAAALAELERALGGKRDSDVVGENP